MGAAIVCCGHKSYIASLLLFNNFVFVGRRKGNVRKAGNEQRRGLYDYEQGIVPIILRIGYVAGIGNLAQMSMRGYCTGICNLAQVSMTVYCTGIGNLAKRTHDRLRKRY